MVSNKPVALITGASRGIGKAVALKLATMGYQLALVAKHSENLRALADELAQQKVDTFIFPLDVTDSERVNQAVSELIAKTGRIDILFNSAGILTRGTSDPDPSALKQLLDVNVVGTFNFIHAVVPQMKKQQKGYIFNVASLAGKEAKASVGIYAASKFAVVGLSESLFKELAPHNIKVTALCPSFVDTDMVRGSQSITGPEMIRPEDIAETIAYLLSLSPTAYVQEVLIRCQKLIGSG